MRRPKSPAKRSAALAAALAQLREAPGNPEKAPGAYEAMTRYRIEQLEQELTTIRYDHRRLVLALVILILTQVILRLIV